MSPSPFCPMAGCSLSSFGGLRRLDLETGSFELLLAQPGAAFLGPDGRHVLLLRHGERQLPRRYGFRVRPERSARLAADDSWQPGLAHELGSVWNARRHGQPGWNRPGRSGHGRRAASSDRPSRTYLGSAGGPHRAPRGLGERGRHGSYLAHARRPTAAHVASRRTAREAPLADERSHCPGRIEHPPAIAQRFCLSRAGIAIRRPGDVRREAREPSPRVSSSSSRADSRHQSTWSSVRKEPS